MKYWKQFNLWFCCGMLGLAWAILPVIPGWAKTVDRIIAKVNEKIITQSELEERAVVKVMALQRNNVQPMPSEKEVMYEELERMIEERLLIDAGQKLGLKVGEENVTKAIDEIKRNNGLGDGDLEKMLQAESKSLEEYRGKIHDQILVSRVVGFEVRKRVTVSKKEIEEYYNNHLKDYWVSEKLQLRHILFLIDDTLPDEDKRFKRQKARQALRKIRSGADFIVVAKEFSEDISASTGGDLGEIERGKMVPEFEKAAFRLKEGEVSGLVETPYGLHIIKVDKVIPGQTLPLDKVQDAIKTRFFDEKMKAEYKAYVSQLRKNAFIESKMSPPVQSAVTDSRKPATGKTLRPSLDREDVFADIPSPQKNKNSSRQLSQEREFSRFQTFEEELRYYKQLRNNNKISEGEYQKKKRKLLSRF
jgi:parvulin-like peptidyl-prolyl isomerase